MRKLLVLFCFLLLCSCVSFRLEKNLDPKDKEFLSQVRYIITNQERKIFLNIPPSERKAFVEEFWKKRDPDPYTEENEYKDQYFSRIEEANRIFKEGTTQGWLQERGRIYILIGPPNEREVYPSGTFNSNTPMEIWYYGFFPIVFIDSSKSGNYELEPLSARHISELNRAQLELKPFIAQDRVVFDFKLEIKKVEENKLFFQIEIPYKNIWFKATESKLQTELDLFLEAYDSSQKKVWELKKKYPISLAEKDWKDLQSRNFLIEIPATLIPGNYSMNIDLENKTDGNRIRKKITFTI